MAYKRILTVQDISCVGQCSMTVALPILSACGVETCVLPTAILSTHTGGFGKPVIRHLSDSITLFRQHWRQENITFDAIYTGYLGCCEDIQGVLELVDELLAPGGILIVDPAMADHGRLYSGFDDTYVSSMAQLCNRADMLLPNVTEAALLTGTPYAEGWDLEYARGLVKMLPQQHIILTGVGNRQEETGVLIRTDGSWNHICRPRVPGRYSGTGDLFAACFIGAFLQGTSVVGAAEIAAELTELCVRKTWENPAHSYGIRFESILPELIRRVNPE